MQFRQHCPTSVRFSILSCSLRETFRTQELCCLRKRVRDNNWFNSTKIQQFNSVARGRYQVFLASPLYENPYHTYSMLHQKWHLSAWHDCQYEEHLRRLLTSMISQHIYILFLDSCCSCARLGAVVYRCSQVYDTTRMPATDGMFSRSFWLSATLTVFTPAARPVSRTFTMGPMILTSSSSPPPVPARYGLISASTWNLV